LIGIGLQLVEQQLGVRLRLADYVAKPMRNPVALVDVDRIGRELARRDHLQGVDFRLNLADLFVDGCRWATCSHVRLTFGLKPEQPLLVRGKFLWNLSASG